LLAVGLHTCTAVARSLCVSWAFLLLNVSVHCMHTLETCSVLFCRNGIYATTADLEDNITNKVIAGKLVPGGDQGDIKTSDLDPLACIRDLACIRSFFWYAVTGS